MPIVPKKKHDLFVTKCSVTLSTGFQLYLPMPVISVEQKVDDKARIPIQN